MGHRVLRPLRPGVLVVMSIVLVLVLVLVLATITVSAAGASPRGASPRHPARVVVTTGWRVRVASVAPEAQTPELKTAPQAGYDYEIVTLTVTRLGRAPRSPILLTPVLLDARHAERGAEGPVCYGGTPYNNRVYRGATVTTSTCISVPTAAATHLVVGVGTTLSRRWLRS